MDLGCDEAHAGVELYSCIVVVVAGLGEAVLAVAEEGGVVGAELGDVIVAAITEGGKLVACLAGGLGKDGLKEEGEEGEEPSERRHLECCVS